MRRVLNKNYDLGCVVHERLDALRGHVGGDPSPGMESHIRSARVLEVLSKLISVHGAPKYLRSDNGPEFISRAILRWVTEAKIEIDAKILIEDFRRQFNEVRPHSSLGQLTPVEFKQRLLTTDPGRAISKEV